MTRATRRLDEVGGRATRLPAKRPRSRPKAGLGRACTTGWGGCGTTAFAAPTGLKSKDPRRADECTTTGQGTPASSPWHSPGIQSCLGQQDGIPDAELLHPYQSTRRLRSCATTSGQTTLPRRYSMTEIQSEKRSDPNKICSPWNPSAPFFVRSSIRK